jgi:hypothetical protein
MSKPVAGWLFIALLVAVTIAATGAADGRPPGDARLATRVQRRALQVPLGDLCWVTQQQTGVPHRVADTAAGDLLVSVVGELSLEELHRSLALCLGLVWTRVDRDGKPEYVARRDPRVMAAEQRAQVEAEQAFKLNLAQLTAIAELPADVLEEPGPRKAGDLRAYVRQPTNREAARFIGQLSPAQQDQIAAGLPVSLPYSSFSPAAQDRLRTLGGLLSAVPLPPGAPGRPIDFDDGNAWTVTIHTSPAKSRASSSSLLVSISSSDNPGVSAGLTVPVPHPNFGDPGTFQLPGDPPRSRDARVLAPLPEGSSPSGFSWEDHLVNLQRAAQLPVVSDAYRFENQAYVQPCQARPEEPLAAYLDRACRPWKMRWGSVGPVLAFQCVDRPRALATQVPESVIRHWREHVIQTGVMKSDHLVKLAALTPRQLSNLEPVMGPEAATILQHRPLWLLWHGMSDAQVSHALGDGVRMVELPIRLQQLAAGIAAGARDVTNSGIAITRIKASDTRKEFALELRLAVGKPVRIAVRLLVAPQRVAQLKQQEELRLTALRAAAEGQ